MHITNEEAPGASNTEGLHTHITEGAILPDAQGRGKAFATLQAQFAILGHTLSYSVARGDRGDDSHPSYQVSRWGQSQSFSTLDQVGAFLRQIGGAA